jgi:hypothetical protein
MLTFFRRASADHDFSYGVGDASSVLPARADSKKAAVQEPVEGVFLLAVLTAPRCRPNGR